ncbi:MAG: NAD-dependent epimerase/dehydratase family protein [Planctomycetes bacterium]|nr:NAD-dependent epimerase/dehydratase family protein [Planctomycetota bacterium]
MTHTLVTGGAGFIGSHLVEALLESGDAVTVFDNFDPYYDPSIKRATAASLVAKGAVLHEGDLRDVSIVEEALQGVDRVVHLAARPGVRASIRDPHTTISINVTGTTNLLEAMHQAEIRRLVFASSSSVYGGDSKAPFREDAPASHPLSPYAASKRAGEHFCASYSELFGFSITALRFFTVYGPRGRPDMLIGKFVAHALRGEPVPLYGDGSVVRDLTYVSDIVAGIRAALDDPADGFEVVNLGGGRTITILELIKKIELALGTELVLERHPAAAGDMPLTSADLTRATARLGFKSLVDVDEGLRRTVAWAREAL